MTENSREDRSSNAATLDAFRRATVELRRAVRGKDDFLDQTLVAMVAGGHILIEDIPGVGKSTLARALALVSGCSFRRIQFTSDLLPADVVGSNVWLSQDQRFEFQPGPIFANLILADEINRAPPRTQSALLEAMGESRVSIDGKSYDLPDPFMVVATQNPVQHHGTYPLPESQLDRFMLRLRLGYADEQSEIALLLQGGSDSSDLDAVLSETQICIARAASRRVHLHEDLASYAQRVVASSRTSPSIILGVSTRGALAWVAAARARAFLRGAAAVTPDDLASLAVPALAHRIVLTGAHSGSDLAEDTVRDLLAKVAVPR